MKKTILCAILAALSLNSLAGTSFSRPSFRPSTPSFRPSVPTPRPVVINRTTVIQQHSSTHAAPSGGGFFGPLLGAAGGAMLGNWLMRPNEPQQQPAPSIDCGLEANKAAAICQPAK